MSSRRGDENDKYEQALANTETATPQTTSPAGMIGTVESLADPADAPARQRTIHAGDRLGRYEVIEEIGVGGMATVWRARDTELRRDVAIKTLFPHLSRKPEIVRRFDREARAAAGLEHPHILRIYDVGGAGGADPPYIVMELVRGKSLRELCEQHAPMLAELAACIGALLCDALAAAHAAGVIHRDVKPGNVMVAAGGRLLLADFGVARIVDDDDSLVTRTGALLGTPSFMSPEQAQGAELDGRSDLYSVGATLYQLATGSLPFVGSTARVVSQILRGDWVAPLRRNPAMGAELARVIEALMAPEPSRRPVTAEDAARRLRQVAAAGGLADAEAEVTAFAEDPAAYQPARREGVLAGVLARARAALARRALPEAMALANRAAALAPHDAAVESLVAEIAAGGRRRRTAAVAGAAIAVGTAVAATWAAVGLGDGSSRVAVRLPDARVDADAGIDSGPEISGAGPDQVRIDAGSVIEDAPYAGADAALEGGSLARLIDAGRLLPRHRSLPQHVSFDAGSSPTIAPLVPDAAPPADEPVAAPLPARLTLVMDAWCDVSVDGVDHGRADRRRPIVLPAGPHRVVCRQGPGLGGWSDLLTLTPGEDRTVTGSVLRPVVVIVGVEGGDAVAIDGKAYRRGATARLRPGRYRVAITRGGREVTAGWVSVPRVESCALRDVPELDCYQ